MRAVVQRVRRARVTVQSPSGDGSRSSGIGGDAELDPASRVTGEIGPGFCVLLSVGPGDTEATAEHLAERVARLRVCPDAEGRMNIDLHQWGGSVLVVSQFTLHADTSRGHRPSFIGAAPPEHARRLCDRFSSSLARLGLTVAGGEFGAHMRVELVNDGPVTLVLSSGEGPWPADAG